MALRGRGVVSKDVKKSSYYVWYLGAREAKGVDAMPSAIDYLLERERSQEPFKVTLQVSSKGLKIIQTVLPGGSMRSAVKHLVPGHAVLAAVQREDVVAATLLLPNPASNNPVHVHAYRCDSVETAELLGGQLKLLAVQSESLARLSSLDSRLRSNLGSDGRSTRESESSEGSGELRHAPIQSSSIYESLAAELRAKLGRSGGAESDAGPLLLPPRDYDTVHRQRGNLTGIELRRCLNQTIVGSNGVTPIVEHRAGARSAASSGIGSDSAATPPPYPPQQHQQHQQHQHQHPLGPRPSRPTRDSSSDEDWGGPTEELDYLADRVEPTSVSLPRLPSRSPERGLKGSCQAASGTSPGANRTTAMMMMMMMRRSAEQRQRSPSPQYQPRLSPGDGATSPRERFHDAKEMFRQMEREAVVARIVHSRPETGWPLHRSEPVSRQSSHEETPLQSQRSSRPQQQQQQQQFFGQTLSSSSSGGQPQQLHDRLTRRGAITQQQQLQAAPTTEALPEPGYRSRPRLRANHYLPEQQQQQSPPTEPELPGRPRPKSFYEMPLAARELRGPRNPVDSREAREFARGLHAKQQQQQQRPRPFTYGELAEHERYPGLDRENARPALESSTPARYRHSYAEPPRLGIAALHPY